MSSQTGITPSEDLKKVFSEAEPDTRAIRVIIKEEQMIPEGTIPTSGTWEEDYDITQWLNPASPCYILYRLDSKTTETFDWIIISYVPDDSRVREKMLYAASRATLTKVLGDNKFVDSLYGSIKDEITLESIKNHKKIKSLPLTLREKEMKELNRAESENDISITTRFTVAPSVAFPFSQDTQDALEKFKNNELSYIKLSVSESVELDGSNNNFSKIDDIRSELPSESPCFIFMKFAHEFKSANVTSTIFIYSCPEKSKVKERMIYSSARNTVVNYVENDYKIKLDKKIEISNESDLDEQSIIEDLHAAESRNASPSNSPLVIHKRPAPPGRRRVRK
ncbi:actin depolymerizing protein [Piromyces finnis]|uniref:Twinfilin n=1 Tax=Piromyces finnis TaxID=1754191 RepID=A0A1Y1VDA3_9FUNG|nr:actin depolymerizing protein [Piromyces finnis]|eukprot:ORX53293.1 actin depolymerizing protein [Piromyces finnis]